MSAAKYIHQRQFPSLPEPGLNVKAMEVSKPVVVSVEQIGTPQLLQITATATFTSRKVDVVFNSADGHSHSGISNAHCVVEYEDAAEWSSQWKRNAYLIESRIRELEHEAACGNAHRILRGMAYKLFSALVQYSKRYQGMEEILLLSTQREAIARVKFQADSKDGTFLFNPYWIDSLAHISGFVLNANDAVDSGSHVFISHGWASMRFAGQFSAEKTYRTYVKMQPEVSSTTIMSGDVYVFENDTIVGLMEGLKFQQVRRTVLDHLIPNTNRLPTAKKVTAPIVSAGPAKIAENASLNSSEIVNPKVLAPVKVFSGPSVVDRVGEIIVAEVGISVAELLDETSFAELGIDSLLSLTIIGRLREEMRLDLSSTLFLEHVTYGSLRAHLHKLNATTSHSEPGSRQTMVIPTIIHDRNFIMTPSITPSTGVETPSETSTGEMRRSHEANITIRTVVADEMGISLNEIPADVPLGSLGMDSLMSLTITASIREKIGIEIPSDLLANNPSMSELEKKLNTSTSYDAKVLTLARGDTLRDSITPYYPTASSMLLQGKASDSRPKLFLFPDGSGSATSYSSLPPLLSTDLAVFGLNSPFLKSPRDWTCGIRGVAQIYITEIKHRQAQGPYLLGGWSAGGIMAYEAAHQLIQAGEHVEQLLLIDSPCPLALAPLPTSLLRFFDTLGLFGPGQKSPAWLLEHFDATVANLHRYSPIALDVSKVPQTLAIWAREGVCNDASSVDYPRPAAGEESRSTSWMLDDRTDLGPNGWDALLGPGKVSGVGVPGNHFTMMREPSVSFILFYFIFFSPNPPFFYFDGPTDCLC